MEKTARQLRGNELSDNDILARMGWRTRPLPAGAEGVTSPRAD